MPPETLAEFERLLRMPDPELHDMILYPEIAPAGDFAALIALLRIFHGLQ
jgi:succinate dehydrogenase flavin-adding protein (antitoxin of CptAB toxin-antitoxin module)